jgi:solute carrier family 34 (sodium-dependent phosphate cotransporter)
VKYLQHKSLRFAASLVQGALIVLVFLLSIDLLVIAFGRIGQELIQSFLAFTANPFVSLFIGLLVTAIVQSSSVTTSMFVALVASGSIGLDRAIPMVIGANIGTTLTSNLVAMSFIIKKQEFRNAFSAAVSHDFFNLFTAIILLPLEYFYQFLSRLSQGLTRLITPDALVGLRVESESYPGLFKLNNLFNDWLFQSFSGTVLLLVLALVLLFFSVKLITRKIYRILVGTARVRFERYMFHNPYRSFGWGALFTAGIQSSSVTTSLIVPLVATERVSLEKAFPFILGANLGTPITALLAALFKTETAVSLALAHFMFNLIGVVIFLPFPPLRKLITRLAGFLGYWTMKHWVISLVYIILVFFLIPFAFISIW